MTQSGAGAYLAGFLLMTLAFIGIPAVGPAVFFTPTLVSGILRMKYSQFVVWNFVVGSVYVLSIGLAAYGAGKIAANEQDGGSLAALVARLAIATGCAMLAARYYRRRRARSLAGRASAGEAGG